MQSEHVSLPDFYLQWLMAVMEVSKLAQNPFAAPLTGALTKRLENLKTSRAFKMALYLDPRLNYMGSKLFSVEEKELVQVISCIYKCFVTRRELVFANTTLGF